MAAGAPNSPPYSEPEGVCLRHRVARRWPVAQQCAGALAALALAALCAGCSYSYKLGTLFGEDKESERTASLAGSAGTPAESAPETDLAFAKAAAAELLAKGGKDSSAPWENPRTGARGTITPIAAAYNRDGFVCHDFLASHVMGDKESWYQGGACRIHGGRWEVRDFRPLQRT
jgi:surface antigen